LPSSGERSSVNDVSETRLNELRAQLNEAQQEFDKVSARIEAGDKFAPADIEKKQGLAERLKVLKTELSKREMEKPS
jgi:hypothetical protein